MLVLIFFIALSFLKTPLCILRTDSFVQQTIGDDLKSAVQMRSTGLGLLIAHPTVRHLVINQPIKRTKPLKYVELSIDSHNGDTFYSSNKST